MYLSISSLSLLARMPLLFSKCSWPNHTDTCPSLLRTCVQMVKLPSDSARFPRCQAAHAMPVSSFKKSSPGYTTVKTTPAGSPPANAAVRQPNGNDNGVGRRLQLGPLLLSPTCNLQPTPIKRLQPAGVRLMLGDCCWSSASLVVRLVTSQPFSSSLLFLSITGLVLIRCLFVVLNDSILVAE